MGTIQHHAVIATTSSVSAYRNLEAWIVALPVGERPLFIFNSYAIVNEAHTIVLTPDGSKEGWTESDQGDDLRTRFICQIKSYDYSDGSNPFDYIEVSYGELGVSLLRTNNVEDEQ